jgi:signal transduction histidine kinase
MRREASTIMDIDERSHRTGRFGSPGGDGSQGLREGTHDDAEELRNPGNHMAAITAHRQPISRLRWNRPNALSPRTAVIAASIALAAVTLVLAVLRIPLAHVAPSLALVLGTAQTVLALVVASLAFARYRATADVPSGFEASGFLVLAMAGGVGTVAEATGMDRSIGLSAEAPTLLPLYLWGVAGLLGAALFVVAALPPAQAFRRPVVLGAVAFVMPAVLLGDLVVAGLVDPLQLGAAVPAEQSGPAGTVAGAFAASGTFSVIHLLCAALFALAAVAYLRRTTPRGAIPAPFFVMGCILAAFAQAHFALAPVTFTGVVATGDVLEFGFFAVLFVGLQRATREDLSTLRESHELLRESRAAEVADAESRQRMRLARELHDGLVQQLWAASLDFEQLRSLIGGGDRSVRHQADRVGHSLSAAATEARRTLHVLRSSEPAVAALADVLPGRLRELYERWGYTTELHDDGSLAQINGALTAELVRICDEALTNIQKHADATAVRITVGRTDEGIALSISDNGRGFTPRRQHSGVGLVGMRERAARIGARLTIESADGDGTRVTLVVPEEEAA